MFLKFFLIFVTFLQLVLSISKEPLLLVVSFDAFRHDFLSKNATPNLFALSQLGAKADHIRNVFPTKTFPNHFSIGTGVFAEDHGVLANKVFFNNHSVGYSYELFHFNEDVIPIWTLNEKGGKNRHSGSMMWPGGEFAYQGVTPTHVMPFVKTFEWTRRVDKVISWFLNDTAPANLVMLYFEEPDYVGHRRGIYHPLFQDQLQHCDKTAKYIMDQLEAHKLKNKVNVFFLSDHGMVSVKQDHIIDLNDFADMAKFNLTGTSPVIQINAIASLDPDTKKKLINSTYSELKEGEFKSGHFKVYLKDEIPGKYRYKHNPRVSDMLAVAEIDFAFQDLTATIEYYRKNENITVTPDSEFGVHGYSNEEPTMFPFFFALGPEIKRNFSIAPFDNVDLYPLWANMLRLKLPKRTTRYQLRGDVEHVTPMLVSTIPSFGLSTLTIGLLSIGLFSFMLLFSILSLAIWNSKMCHVLSNRLWVINPSHRDRDYVESGITEEREALIKVVASCSNETPDAGAATARFNPSGSGSSELEDGSDEPSSSRQPR